VFHESDLHGSALEKKGREEKAVDMGCCARSTGGRRDWIGSLDSRTRLVDAFDV
jgi:hypothetical protein